MGNKNKIITYGLLALIFTVLIPFGAGAEGPPCLAYGFTLDPDTQHASFMREGSTLFGNDAYIVTDCQRGVSILVNGEVVGWTNGTRHITLPSGPINVTLENDDFTTVHDSLFVISSGYLSTAMAGLPDEQNPNAILMDPEDQTIREVYVAIGSGFIAFAMVVGLMWPIINRRVDRNFIEEVVR